MPRSCRSSSRHRRDSPSLQTAAAVLLAVIFVGDLCWALFASRASLVLRRYSAASEPCHRRMPARGRPGPRLRTTLGISCGRMSATFQMPPASIRNTPNIGDEMIIKRRAFLGQVAAGSAIVSDAGLSCRLQRAAREGCRGGHAGNPFMDWFGVDQAMVTRVMAELTANGADAADLYFQHTRNNFLQLEDGIVSNAYYGHRAGCGPACRHRRPDRLCVHRGPDAGNHARPPRELPRPSHARAAAVAPLSYDPQAMGGLYTTSLPWADVGIDRKLPLLKFVEARGEVAGSCRRSRVGVLERRRRARDDRHPGRPAGHGSPADDARHGHGQRDQGTAQVQSGSRTSRRARISPGTRRTASRPWCRRPSIAR